MALPEDYPYSPPIVYYHSVGPRIHPNLYENGRVCLSLLGTWEGMRVCVCVYDTCVLCVYDICVLCVCVCECV